MASSLAVRLPLTRNFLNGLIRCDHWDQLVGLQWSAPAFVCSYISAFYELTLQGGFGQFILNQWTKVSML